MKELTSRDNATYKALAKLATSSSERRRTGQSVLDGAHLLQAFLDGGFMPEAVYASREGRQRSEVAALLERCAAQPQFLLGDALFAALSTVESPTGILAVIRTPPPRPVPATAGFVLLLEAIQDPGNVGTLLRSAAAAGVEHVLLSAQCAFAWSPKVVRAGMGAHFALNIVEGADLGAFVGTFAGSAIALEGGAGRSLYELDLRGPVAFLVGNEGAGLSPAVLEAADVRAHIPLSPRVESLNAGVAGAVALFEAARQRRMRA